MKNLDDDTITWLYRVTDEEDIQSSSTVCRACNMYIQRHKGDDTCTRWKREVPHLKQKCIVKGCGCESARKGAVTVGIVSNILGDLNENDTKWLCNAHYQRLYKCLNSREPCASCGEKPKFNNKQYYRHCPDPTLITKYLKEVEGLEVDITPDSVVCDQC
jgi:hypothetical protein